MPRLLTALACLTLAPGAAAQPWSEQQLATAAQLRDAALAGTGAYDIVASLTTEVGPRPPGSAGDKAAVAWAQRQLAELGLQDVRAIPVTVPHWERGSLDARIVAPWPQALVATALGGSIGTAESGLQAEVVGFDTLEQLGTATPAQVAGKIVYIGQPARRDATWAGYVEAVPKRVRGPSIAARLGAAALLIRSVGTSDARVPHTGGLSYQPDAPKIPAAALSNPDADLLERMLASGQPVRVHLRMTARDLPLEQSANVIGELPGTDLKDEIVLIGAHLDSWDLGTGAIDDGAGVAVVSEVAAMLVRAGIKPRRTLRVVLFASEEYKLAGATAYASQPDDEIARHVLVMEADAGAGRPLALNSRMAEDQLAKVEVMAGLLAPLGVTRGNNETTGGADVGLLVRKGVPALAIQQDLTNYLDAHHSPNDTLGKIDRQTLDQVVAAYVATVYLALH